MLILFLARVEISDDVGDFLDGDIVAPHTTAQKYM